MRCISFILQICILAAMTTGCEDQWLNGLPVFPNAHQPCESYVPYDPSANYFLSEIPIYRITPCQGVPHISFPLALLAHHPEKLLELIDAMLADHPHPTLDVVFIESGQTSIKKNQVAMAEVVRQLQLKGVPIHRQFLIQKIDPNLQEGIVQIYVRSL